MSAARPGAPGPVDHEPVADVQIVHGASCGVAPDPTAPGCAATSLAAGPARGSIPSARNASTAASAPTSWRRAQRAERGVPERTVEAGAVPRADVRVRLVGRGIAGGEADVDPDPAGQLDRDGEVEVLGPQRRRADGAVAGVEAGQRVGPVGVPVGQLGRRRGVDDERGIGLERRQVASDVRFRRQLDADERGRRPQRRQRRRSDRRRRARRRGSRSSCRRGAAASRTRRASASARSPRRAPGAPGR